jgi:hypothetical protein
MRKLARSLWRKQGAEMPGRIKILGLMSVAVLAFVCVAANPATSQAARFKAEKLGVDLKGGPEIGGPETLETFQFDYGITKCKESAFTGQMAVTESLLMILDPVYGKCTTNGLETTVAMKTCDYEFSAGPGLIGPLNILCKEKDEMTFTVSLGGVTKCTMSIPKQVREETGFFSNMGIEANRRVGVEIVLENFSYSQKEGTGVGKCTAVNKANGFHTGTTTVSAESQEEKGVKVGFWVE